MLRRYAWLVGLPLLLGLGWLLWVAAPAGSAPGTALSPAAGAASVLAQPLPRFLLQLLVVLAAAKLAGALMRRIGQPAVIGEMLAGIVLGPSLLGWAWPGLHAAVFPAEGLGAFKLVSQLGVLVFMFAAGAEFELSRLRGQRRLALVVGHAGIALPFLFGLLLAWPLAAAYAPAGTDFIAFALFLGVALSVTAFPVLLRIIEERGYRGLPVATLAIACAAISDASAWAILGAVVAWTQSQGPGQLLLNLGLSAALAWALLGPLRARLARDGEKAAPAAAMVGLILMALACALVTELIGLHLLFGAFLAGLAVSGSPTLRDIVTQRFEPFAVVVLLPLFFASTGLATRVDLLSGTEWLLCLGLTGVATLGKLGGTVLAARWCGVVSADAWRLGILMNTRGLMELIVLSLGYELGLIDQRLYAILVLVAIVTTVLTGPLLGWLDRRAARTQSTAT
jgi:Kef-type K+ transport system membrane component KefB